MRLLTRILKYTLWTIATILFIAILTFFLYNNSFRNVNPTTVAYYTDLKEILVKEGFRDKLLVISTKRDNWHNELLIKFGASSKSRHLDGDAIDILVLDVNDDGQMDGKDVDIVYQIIDKQILKGKGGLGTYKTEDWIWNRQMIHMDCRQGSSRWNR
jgi:uncharacterized protein YcbK (DUF882 family)